MMKRMSKQTKIQSKPNLENMTKHLILSVQMCVMTYPPLVYKKTKRETISNKCDQNTNRPRIQYKKRINIDEKTGSINDPTNYINDPRQLLFSAIRLKSIKYPFR